MIELNYNIFKFMLKQITVSIAKFQSRTKMGDA